MLTRSILATLALMPALASADLVTDDFNRANGTVGANWTTTGDSGLLITSNQVAHTTADDRHGSIYTGTAFGSDQFAEAELTGFDSTPAGTLFFSLYCRASGTFPAMTFDGYVLGINLVTDQYNINRFDNSVVGASVIGGLQSMPAYSVGDVFRLECEGTTVSFFQNGSLVDSGTDSTYSAGSPGLDLYRDNTGDTSTTADNFRAGDCLTTPSITSIDGDDSFTADDTSIPIVGTGFCDDQGTTGSVTIYQTLGDQERTCAINSWSDTLINADCSGLVGFGVTNGLLYGTKSITVTNDAPE